MRSPDMKRLCEAAAEAADCDDIELTEREVEAIVRAVLTELREPSEGMVEVGTHILDDHGGPVSRSLSRRKVEDLWPAMIDAILSEAPDA